MYLHKQNKTFLAFFSAATRTMLFDRLSRARPTLLLLTLSVDDALLRWRRLLLTPDLGPAAAATEEDATAAAGRVFLPEPWPASPRSFVAVVVSFAAFPCRLLLVLSLLPAAKEGKH